MLNTKSIKDAFKASKPNDYSFKNPSGPSKMDHYKKVREYTAKNRACAECTLTKTCASKSSKGCPYFQPNEEFLKRMLDAVKKENAT